MEKHQPTSMGQHQVPTKDGIDKTSEQTAPAYEELGGGACFSG